MDELLADPFPVPPRGEESKPPKLLPMAYIVFDLERGDPSSTPAPDSPPGDDPKTRTNAQLSPHQHTHVPYI